MEIGIKPGDRIEVTGSYDYDPLYLKNPPANKRTGTVLKSIIGQNDTPALVIKIDEVISGNIVKGDIIVLELRHKGITWKKKEPSVQIELCDFVPENKAWKDRRQGEWIESAATFKKI